VTKGYHFSDAETPRRPSRARRGPRARRERRRVRGRSFSVEELAKAGVKRISLATSLYRAAMSGLFNAAREVKEQGTFGYVDTAMSTPELNGFMRS